MNNLDSTLVFRSFAGRDASKGKIPRLPLLASFLLNDFINNVVRKCDKKMALDLNQVPFSNI